MPFLRIGKNFEAGRPLNPRPQSLVGKVKKKKKKEQSKAKLNDKSAIILHTLNR